MSVRFSGKHRLTLAMIAMVVVGPVAQAFPSDPTPELVQVKEMIGKTLLPEAVPYLNKKENFFIGNGVVGGGGAGDGRWNFLTGPDYTCPNYLGNEEIRLEVDGAPQVVTMDAHRARDTGIFYGVTTIGDLEVCVVDYAIRGEPWLARLVMIKNKSATTAHQVSVQAYITPQTGAGRSAYIAKDSSGRDSGVSLKLDTSLKCMKNRWCQNWANRNALITFNEPTCTATNNNGTYVLDSGVKSIAAGGFYDTALYHYMHYDDKADGDYFAAIRKRPIISDAEEDMHEWQIWFAEVAPEYSLDRIKDPRARDIVEGGLATIKMNQASDGGIVANERGYNISYIRDACCALRGLNAAGHFDESKHFIQWLDHKFSVHGLIPNGGSCGSDTYAHPSGNNGKSSLEANASVELTALYLLAVRDYFHATHDLQTLKNADKSLRYAMDIQLKQLALNGDKLEFNGDETELCRAVDTSATGYDRNLARYWSMTSIALCSASLEFYTEYLKAKGADPASYVNSQNNQTLNLHDELGKLQDALETDFWRTDVSECPGGFHDWFRVKSDGSWPHARLNNFTLFPVYFGTPLKYPERAKQDVAAVLTCFNPTTRMLPLVGGAGDGRALGHDLGYLLWALVATGDPKKDAVYDGLVNGPTVQCWGTYNEAYDANGKPNVNGLRSFETGVDISAIAKYWGLGSNGGNGQ